LEFQNATILTVVKTIKLMIFNHFYYQPCSFLCISYPCEPPHVPNPTSDIAKNQRAKESHPSDSDAAIASGEGEAVEIIATPAGTLLQVEFEWKQCVLLKLVHDANADMAVCELRSGGLSVMTGFSVSSSFPILSIFSLFFFFFFYSHVLVCCIPHS
jgi:hypothetical protein